jgi:Flp pilus assembly pilin Flp
MMKFFKLKKFHNEEDGAVTVDWVVLTAAVVGLGFAALSLVSKKTGALTTKIGDYMDSVTISSTFSK